MKHITVRWDEQPAGSHAYAQVIPHLTLHPPHLYAPRRFTPPDSKQPTAAPRRAATDKTEAAQQSAIAQPAVTAYTRIAVKASSEQQEGEEHEGEDEEDKLPSRASATRGPPSFPSSPNKARLVSAQSHIASIDAQLAQLKAEADEEAAGKESDRRQQRSVSATLTRRDVLQFRHSGCTGNVRLNEQVSALMGPQHSHLAQLYQPRHKLSPPLPAQQHEQRGTVDSRNAAVSTAPFVFFSSQPRFDTENREHTTDAAQRGRRPVEEEVQEVKQRALKAREEASVQRTGRLDRTAALASPRRLLAARRAVTDKPAARSWRDGRAHGSSATGKAGRPSIAATEASASRAVKQSSPPPLPNPPPPAPTPRLGAPQQPVQQPRTELPPRPGWLSWRVGPGTNTNQPAAHVVDDSHALLTIGRAEWKEVEVGGERRGKARVRQRRLEDEWQWHERLSREKRQRDVLTQQSLLAVDHGRVREYDAAIEREKALERQARQQLMREEQRLEAMMRQARQAAKERYDSGGSESAAEWGVHDAWSAHPFIHPSFPPPPPPSLPSARPHPALSHSVSPAQHSHFTAAPSLTGAQGTSRAASAAHTVEPATKHAVANAPTTAKPAASQKATRLAYRAPEQRTSENTNKVPRQLPPHRQPQPQPQLLTPPQQLQQQHEPAQQSFPSSSFYQPPQLGTVPPPDEIELRLQRHVQRYMEQLQYDTAMVGRDEQYVRGMGSKDVRRQRMLNNIARARRDVRQKEADLAALRRQLIETRQRREAAAAAVVARPSPHSFPSAAYRSTTGRARAHSSSSASKAVQVPDVFVAVRETSSHATADQDDEERWRLQRSIEERHGSHRQSAAQQSEPSHCSRRSSRGGAHSAARAHGQWRWRT